MVKGFSHLKIVTLAVFDLACFDAKMGLCWATVEGLKCSK
jgi:hypothetical protein